MLYITDAYHHYDYIFFLLFFVPFLYLISVKLNQKNEQKKIFIFIVYITELIITGTSYHHHPFTFIHIVAILLLLNFFSFNSFRFLFVGFFWARTRFLEFQFSLRGNLWFFWRIVLKIFEGFTSFKEIWMQNWIFGDNFNWFDGSFSEAYNSKNFSLFSFTR